MSKIHFPPIRFKGYNENLAPVTDVKLGEFLPIAAFVNPSTYISGVREPWMSKTFIKIKIIEFFPFLCFEGEIRKLH